MIGTLSPNDILRHHLVVAITVNSNKLWKKALTVADEVESNLRTLTEVSAPEDGREFIPDLEPPEVELCIEILDHVSSNPLFPRPH